MWAGVLSPLGPDFGAEWETHGTEVEINALLFESSQ